MSGTELLTRRLGIIPRQLRWGGRTTRGRPTRSSYPGADARFSVYCLQPDREAATPPGWAARDSAKVFLDH